MNITNAIGPWFDQIDDGPLFAGLPDEAIKYLYDNGNWEEKLPEGFNIEGKTKAFMYIADPETQSAGFLVIDEGKTLFGTFKAIIKHPYTGMPTFGLKEYQLKDGRLATESIQGMICNYFLLCLETSDGEVIYWDDEAIYEIGEECGATEVEEFK